MECIEARALKSSVLSQMAMRTNFHNDDVWYLAGINNCTTDDFVIEDLLNLDFPEIELQDGDSFDEEKLSQKRNSNESSSIFSGADEFDSLSTEKLNVTVEDLENLEWLSQFVNDSTSEISLLLPAGSFTKKTGSTLMNRIEPLSKPVQKVRVPIFPSPVPKKSRSKSSRSNTASSSSHGSSTPSPFVVTNRVQNADWFLNLEKPVVKKMKRKLEAGSCFISGRRCAHCQVQKTPQWRTGPLGPKTLCNACGVRFKSGRLFPEYRPACSPTFSQEAHSNSHRKVLEMRSKKDMGGVGEPGLTRAVQSF